MRDTKTMVDMLHGVPDQVKHVLDAVSVTAVVSTILGILPAVTAILTFVWTLIRIYETKTVQGWLRKK